jgi:hypothetical protein
VNFNKAIAREIRMTQFGLGRLGAALALVASGAMIGAGLSASNEAQGEVRTTPPPQAFQSGGQLAVPVLKEMAATLHQIDARLARLESIAQDVQAKTAKPALAD